MRVIIKDNYTQVSKWAAEHVIEKINAFKPTKQKPFVLGLPTGSTPIGMYLNLVKAYREGRVSFKNVVTFNMDEYVGLAPTHDQSYHYKIDDTFGWFGMAGVRLNLTDNIALFGEGRYLDVKPESDDTKYDFAGVQYVAGLMFNF